MKTRLLLHSLLATACLLPSFSQSAEILWTQYCQHLDTMRLMAHLDADPTEPAPETVTLWTKDDGDWEEVSSTEISTLSSTALFEVKEWPRHQKLDYKVTCGDSSFEGIFRAEPKPNAELRMLGMSCLKDIGWPWKEAVAELIKQDPDLVYFSGDQIYENDYGSPHIVSKTPEEVPAGMMNYLEKYRQFGLAFRDLLRDRPCIMITDDHDVFENDLWGKGGLLMDGHRTTGGYRNHPDWVNNMEFTQVGVLPAAINMGPHGAGINAYYTSVEYGGVRLAVVEDRKFKSPPSEVISEPIISSTHVPKKNSDAGIEVVRDGDYDCTQLDRADLELLGGEQEAFLKEWSSELKESGHLGAVLSSSPWAHIAMYTRDSADLDSNGWPQSGRNRGLAAIGDAPVVMIHGDVHLGTLFRHGREKWNDGPVSYSLPAFSSNASRRWEPYEAGENRAPGSPENTGQFHDRFGNKMTVYGAGNGLNGYGMIIFDPAKKEITMEFHPMNEERVPIKQDVPGWPHTVQFGK